MSRIKSVNTGPEIRVRKVIHALGCRFRLHNRSLPGSPDIVLPGRKKIIFVHGCFWHGHKKCHRAALPATNAAFWKVKIDGNKARDTAAIRKLRRDGWEVLVIWQCQTREIASLRQHLEHFLKA